MSLYPILSSGITFLSYIPLVLRCIGHEPFHRSGNRMCATEPQGLLQASIILAGRSCDLLGPNAKRPTMGGKQ